MTLSLLAMINPERIIRTESRTKTIGKIYQITKLIDSLEGKSTSVYHTARLKAIEDLRWRIQELSSLLKDSTEREAIAWGISQSPLFEPSNSILRPLLSPLVAGAELQSDKLTKIAALVEGREVKSQRGTIRTLRFDLLDRAKRNFLNRENRLHVEPLEE